MTGLSMLATGWFASRIGPRRTLLFGLALVIVFSALAGAAGSVFEIAAFRLGWGLGNALFIATALSVIVGAATGGLTSAIILYEAALGLGIASGPLLGGLLGDVSWRGPFFGTAVLMAIGFVLIATLLGPVAKPAHRVSIADPLRALSHGGLRSMAIVAVLYNFGFFTILAYTPLLLGMSAHQLGFIYFGWGLLVALTSVFGAQRLERRFGLVAVLGVTLALVAVDLFLGGVFHASQAGLIAVIVVSGALLGIVNTVLTEAVMAAAVVERPIASSAYSFVRFTGGAIAPYLAGKLAEHVSPPRRCTSARRWWRSRRRARPVPAPLADQGRRACSAFASLRLRHHRGDARHVTAHRAWRTRSSGGLRRSSRRGRARPRSRGCCGRARPVRRPRARGRTARPVRRRRRRGAGGPRPCGQADAAPAPPRRGAGARRSPQAPCGRR